MFLDAHLPALGAGFGFRAPYRADLFLQRQQVDFLEITIEHYLDPTPEKYHELQLLREHFTLIPHGLHLSLGSAQGIDPHYLDKFAAFIEEINPPWWSEHISFTTASGIDIGHLSPLPWTQEVIDAFCRNVERVKQTITCPLILENITYMVQFPGAEMAEADFLRTLLEESDCGLLLDVTNLYTNATNHHFDPDSFLDALPPERVVQLHFVGGQWHGDWLLDSHDSPTPEEIWQLLDDVLRRFPIKGMILERDDALPPFTEITQELQRARQLGQQYKRW